ncbi:polyprenol reductase [Ceratitis capitata]|uniref:Polyprenal reductase n=1 Tax=Ceratitis capitata TaxID=7213 RepID=A0A811UMB8_CERCA|nr:polyprenol reductase [Ceratitis capitata]CAD7000342.1 unnamed protein product [Ceratitis capitata]
MLESTYKVLYKFIEYYNFNLINFIFLGFTLVIIVFGSLINIVESSLPDFLRQSFRYGKHSFRGSADAFIKYTEVPKSWFKHFYIFAFAWSLLALFFIFKGFVMKTEAPELVLTFLDFFAGGQANRKVQVDYTSALVASVLMAIQCGRRCYETNFVQIFSKKNKINISHYFVGYTHYFCAILAIMSNTEGFVRGTLPAFSLRHISLLKVGCILIFYYCWTQQYKSNLILVNLRKDAKSGEVKTEKHLLPIGGFFNLVSSPHMFFEICMYAAILGLLPGSTTWLLGFIWVLSNQIANGYLAHQWYKENFENYPNNRKAIIPYII